MRRLPGFALVLAGLLAVSAGSGCSRYRPQQASDIAGYADPNATYAAVLDTVKTEKYKILEKSDAARSVRVRSHVDESDASRVSMISLRVEGAAVHSSASGYLVRADGSTHRLLNNELASLRKALQKKLAAGGSPSAPVASEASVPAASGTLPVAWSEPAYDPAVWGHGNFTCLPVKLSAEEQTQLTLKLSNGENADVLLSLAHAPELCRSPAACKLAGGCPALGMADTERVSRLAARLSKREIGPLATLLSRGQPVATIDLSKHGSIAQALAEKH